MTKTTSLILLTAMAGFMSAPAAVLLVGWETWGATVLTGQAKNVAASQAATGALGSAHIPGAASSTVNNAVIDTVGANTSGTFGTLAGASTDTSVATEGLRAGTTTAQYFEFTITADVGSTLTLDAFHFDTAMGGNQITRTWSLSVLAGSSITEGFISNGIYSNFNGLVQKDIDLTVLADRSLAAGESASFRMDFVGNGSNGNGIRFDNAAISGTVVPEPSAPLLIGAAALLLGLRRNRRQA